MIVIKTNAQRQAEYRRRQKELGEKKRLNIWLSPAAYKRLGMLVAQKAMSQQMLIEWLLTHDSLWKEELSSDEQRVAPPSVEVALPGNLALKDRSKKRAAKHARIAKLPGNVMTEEGDSERQIDLIEDQKNAIPAQFELQL